MSRNFSERLKDWTYYCKEVYKNVPYFNIDKKLGNGTEWSLFATHSLLFEKSKATPENEREGIYSPLILIQFIQPGAKKKYIKKYSSMKIY